MHDSLKGRQSTLWVVHKQFLDQVDSVGGRSGPENFLPRMRLNLRKLKFAVVGVHTMNLLTSGRPKYFYDFDKLVDT